MKKMALVGILTAGFLTFSLGNSVNAESTESTELTEIENVEQEDSFHEGEEPLYVQVDEKTGVIMKVYPAPQFQTFGAGEWDLVGSESWVFNGDASDKRVDNVHRSQGGNFMIRIPAHTLKKTYGSASPYVEFNLYEDDLVGGDDFMGSNKIPYNSKTKNGIDCVFSNINDFLDGGVAEIYTKHWTNYTTTGTVTVKYYD